MTPPSSFILHAKRSSFRRWRLLLPLLLGLLFFLQVPGASSQEGEPIPAPVVVGMVEDRQGQPVAGAEVSIMPEGEGEPIALAITQADGSYLLPIPNPIPETPIVEIERSHFETEHIELDTEAAESLRRGQSVLLPDTTLVRRVGPAFWLATVLFLAVLGLIATGMLQNTMAALFGVAVVFLVSYLGPLLREDLFIFDFQGALRYVDWNVVFLIMGMMIVIAVVERTGIFQWLAFTAYRISRGRMWLLLVALMLFTGVASAFLDNVTTMLLMTPISVQIALALGISPLALLMPEVMASNVIGISTLVGTPTNILIGSFADISFNSFLVNLTPGVILAFAGLALYSQWAYKGELADAREASPAMLAQLEERGRITEPEHLKKAGIVGAGMLVLFVLGEQIHMVPAVTALLGATALLLWIQPDIEEMIEAVDWTTLVFFITLFIVVGAIQEVGLISLIADMIAQVIGDNLILAIFVVTWLSALFSTIIPNIPFTAAMLPVIAFLSATVPGAEGKVLFFCLSVGSALGGNGSLIGASANLVTSGIAERAGYPISYIYFLKKGFPAMIITVGLALIWLLIRFLVLGSAGA
ncbi:MAG: SLC13 family permease [Chloroflexota bacterium]|nr:SLC13 family permease [Chloroflexota bacterium]